MTYPFWGTNPFYMPFQLYGSWMYSTAYYSQQMLFLPFQMLQFMIVMPITLAMLRYMAALMPSVFKV